MKKCIVVLGMHRSGTSAVSGTLSKFGLAFGNAMMQASEDNPKGYYENERIVECNERILELLESSWMDERLFPEHYLKEVWEEPHIIQEARAIMEEEFGKEDRIVIKDPRLCITFPFWEKLLRENGYGITIVLPYRDPYEVALSLQKRDGFSLEKSLLLWMKYMLLALYHASNHPRVFINYATLLHDTEAAVTAIAQKLDLACDQKCVEDIREFLDVGLKHSDSDITSQMELPRFFKELIVWIRELSLGEAEFNQERFETYFQEYHLYNKLFLHAAKLEVQPSEREMEPVQKQSIFSFFWKTK